AGANRRGAGVMGVVGLLGNVGRRAVVGPTTDRYPKEIYYRIFAARYLPADLDRVLYLDPDVVVNGDIGPLYDLPLEGYYFAAASHVRELLTMVNRRRLEMSEDSLYINSGVMLMNLHLLRAEQREEEVFRFVREHKNALLLPDQDIISGLYGSKIYPLDPFRYNMTERLLALHAPFERGLNVEWVRKNSVIIHYCGRMKPWKSGYIGPLRVFYDEAEALLKSMPAAPAP
ncbi:MAG: glycosyltransferase family 8 protein, partial [Oscillospiraceae bacterium]|nr:glycosyltransferase family 8 protein [Oscillospiraceae bacterium]